MAPSRTGRQQPRPSHASPNATRLGLTTLLPSLPPPPAPRGRGHAHARPAPRRKTAAGEATERPAGMAAYRAWRVFGRQLLNKAAIEQLMRWCKEWIQDDEDKTKPRPEPRMPTVKSILKGPKPGGYYMQRVLSGSCDARSLGDVLPGPLPPPGALTHVFPSPLHKPRIDTDDFKAPSIGPVLPGPSTVVPPVVPPPVVVNYAKRWGAAGCALLAGALYFAYISRTGRPTPPTPDARRLDDVVPEAEPATPDATGSDATDPDAVDESTRARARFFMFVLFFGTLCFPADFLRVDS